MQSKFTSEISQRAYESIKFLETVVPQGLITPHTGVICGSGLGGLAAAINQASCVEVAYHDIPHFPPTTGCLPLKLTTPTLLTDSSTWARGKARVRPAGDRPVPRDPDGWKSTVSHDGHTLILDGLKLKWAIVSMKVILSTTSLSLSECLSCLESAP